MLARRIIAVSPDKAFGKRLAVALKAAGGAVDLHSSIAALGDGPLPAGLLVVHFVGELAGSAAALTDGLIARLPPEGRMIALLPRTHLAEVVALMQGSERVAGMLVADDFDGPGLSAMATRVLAGDIFGLDKVVPWGTQIHSCLVGDYQEKSLAIAQLAEFAEGMGVRRKYRESIEQCADEMLMNALYDAPVDDEGRQIFSEIPTKTRISLRVEQKAIVQYACDGARFVLSVRDAFGTLERATVLRYLHKCLHSEQQIDRKAGGAGLGLYLITSSATDVYFNVLPGVATEAVCTFDLEVPKQQLDSFGFFAERIDAAGRLASGPSRRLPAGAAHPVERRAGGAAVAAAGPSRGVIALLVAAIAVVLALVGVVAWPRLFPGVQTAPVEIRSVPPGAAIEVDGKLAGVATDGTLTLPHLEVGRAYPIVARLEGYEDKQTVVQPRAAHNAITLDLVALAAVVRLESSPSGALVELAGGGQLGTTPLTLSTLTPSSTVTLTFKKSGYQDASARLEVPRPGKDTRLIQPLAVSDSLARVRLSSDPPGAQVVQNGNLLAGVVTPAEILVEAGRPVRFQLTAPGKVPALLDPFTPPAGADDLERSATLVDGHELRITSNVAARASIAGAPHCQALELPASCVLAPGRHELELTVPGVAHGPLTRTLTIGPKPTQTRFDIGYVEVAAGKTTLAIAPGRHVRRAAFEAGPRKLTLADGDATRTLTVVVRPGVSVRAP